MPRLFISNGRNTVSIDTAYGRGPNKALPLEIVADVTAAFFPAKTPVELSLCALHLPEGVDAPYNCRLCGDGSLKSGVSLSILINAGIGLDDEMPLIVKGTSPSNYLSSLAEVEWDTATVGRHYYNSRNTIFELDSDYLADSGLPASKLVLYCRKAFHAQFQFLSERVLTNSRLGWILGPPGTGKSTTSLAFASVIPTYRPDWVVTWIHLSRTEYPVCVQFDGMTKRSCIIKDTKIKLLESILAGVGGNHLVFVDGFSVDDDHKAVQKCCQHWRRRNPITRRLVFVCSMSSRGKVKLDEDIMNGVEEFFVYSWTLEEYQAAVQAPGFFISIKQNLDSCTINSASITPSEAVISKFHFAGGSSRFMFHYNTDTVISFLEGSVNTVPNCYLDNGLRQTFIISKYAATQLAIRGGPELIRNLAEATRQVGNTSMDGWLLEMWVFASIRNGGVQMYGIDGEPLEKLLSVGIVRSFDVANLAAIPDVATLWKPVKWNQGGYDAVFTDKAHGRLIFIQVASGKTHKLKIEYLYEVIQRISASSNSYQIQSMEVVVIVEKSKISTFEISEVTGQGLLLPFGWAWGTEKAMVKIRGVAGVSYSSFQN